MRLWEWIALWAFVFLVGLLCGLILWLNLWVNQPCPPGKPGKPDETIIYWMRADSVNCCHER